MPGTYDSLAGFKHNDGHVCQHVETLWDLFCLVEPSLALSVGVCFNFAVLTSSFAPSKNKHH